MQLKFAVLYLVKFSEHMFYTFVTLDYIIFFPFTVLSSDLKFGYLPLSVK